MTGEGGLRPEGGKIPGIVDVDVEAFRPPTIPLIFYRERTRGMSCPPRPRWDRRRLLRNFNPNSMIVARRFERSSKRSRGEMGNKAMRCIRLGLDAIIFFFFFLRRNLFDQTMNSKHIMDKEHVI